VTGCQRVLGRLSDGEWHSSFELTHELQVMTHSRIADLRKQGYEIEQERVPGQTGLRAYRYRLQGALNDGVAEPPQQTPGTTPSLRASQPATQRTGARVSRTSEEVLFLLSREGFRDVELALGVPRSFRGTAGAGGSVSEASDLMDALDLPPELHGLQDAFWEAKRENAKLAEAYYLVLEDMLERLREKRAIQ
jgi:helix-turn-helix protein